MSIVNTFTQGIHEQVLHVPEPNKQDYSFVDAAGNRILSPEEIAAAEEAAKVPEGHPDYQFVGVGGAPVKAPVVKSK